MMMVVVMMVVVMMVVVMVIVVMMVTAVMARLVVLVGVFVVIMVAMVELMVEAVRSLHCNYSAHLILQQHAMVFSAYNLYNPDLHQSLPTPSGRHQHHSWQRNEQAFDSLHMCGH